MKSNYLHQHNSTHVLQVFTSASASEVKLLFVSVFCFSLFFFLCNLFLSSLFVYLHTCSFVWLVGLSVDWLVGWLVGRLFDCLCACTECMFYIFNFLVHTFTLDKICIAIVCICVQTFMCMSRGLLSKLKHSYILCSFFPIHLVYLIERVSWLYLKLLDLFFVCSIMFRRKMNKLLLNQGCVSSKLNVLCHSTAISSRHNVFLITFMHLMNCQCFHNNWSYSLWFSHYLMNSFCLFIES